MVLPKSILRAGVYNVLLPKRREVFSVMSHGHGGGRLLAYISSAGGPIGAIGVELCPLGFALFRAVIGAADFGSIFLFVLFTSQGRPMLMRWVFSRCCIRLMCRWHASGVRAKSSR